HDKVIKKEEVSEGGKDRKSIFLNLPNKLLAAIDVYCDRKFMTRTSFLVAAAVDKLEREGYLKDE
ncbi:MAG: hypothetical protein ACM3RX_02675, partial [Methanococcaceae archaeon]